MACCFLYSAVNCSIDSPALSYGPNLFISHSTFTTNLKKLLKQAGYEPSLYSGHSFQRGGATMHYRLGATILQIQASGDWASQCFVCHLHLSEEDRQAVQKSVLQRSTHSYVYNPGIHQPLPLLLPTSNSTIHHTQACLGLCVISKHSANTCYAQACVFSQTSHVSYISPFSLGIPLPASLATVECSWVVSCPWCHLGTFPPVNC